MHGLKIFHFFHQSVPKGKAPLPKIDTRKSITQVQEFLSLNQENTAGEFDATATQLTQHSVCIVTDKNSAVHSGHLAISFSDIRAVISPYIQTKRCLDARRCAHVAHRIRDSSWMVCACERYTSARLRITRARLCTNIVHPDISLSADSVVLPVL